MPVICCCIDNFAAIDPNDALALEQALQLREDFVGSVSALALDSPEVNQALRHALAIGCDGVFAVENPPACPPWLSMSEALRQLEWDLVLVSNASRDSIHSDGPAQLAERLKTPFIPCTSAIDLHDRQVQATCQFEDTSMVMSAPLPAIIGILAPPITPRLPKLSALVKAKKQPIPMLKLSLGNRPAPPLIRIEKLPAPKREAGKIFRGLDAETLAEFAEAVRAEVFRVKANESE